MKTEEYKMPKSIDILLVNSFAPRPRIASDAALENGLAIIRTYLENKGFRAEVIDEQRIPLLEKGTPQWCIWYLRMIIKLQMKALQGGSKWASLALMLAAWPVHAFALYRRRAYMHDLVEQITDMVKNNNIPVVGIKLWYGEAFRWGVQLAKRIKERCPETVVITGGPQVRVYGEHVAVREEFDLAIMGPGEEMLEKLLVLRKTVNSKQEFLNKVRDAISSTRLIKTGGYDDACTAGEAAAKTLIIPRYRPVDLAGKILFHTIVDGFGCTWNKCSFCSHTRYSTHYKPRPVHEIIEEMKTMLTQGIAFFRFSSSDTPVVHGKKIAQAILDAGLKVNYSMFIRPSKNGEADYEAYCLMIRSGLRAVFMGGETGHDGINERVMNKGVSKSDIIQTIYWIRKAAKDMGQSCRIGLSLIYPCPVTDEITLQEVYEENLSLIKQTQSDTVIVNPPGVFPGTGWFKQADIFGFKMGDNFVSTMMQYEYSIYKPAELWEKLDYTLQGMTSTELLRETGRLRRAVAELGIPTDISDEYLMMTEAIGYTDKLDLLKFKRDTLLDIMAGSTDYTREIVQKINAQSNYLANLNVTTTVTSLHKVARND
jgi:radical SAM superfamily enzyme YgiQ (UPF0313 family)